MGHSSIHIRPGQSGNRGGLARNTSKVFCHWQAGLMASGHRLKDFESKDGMGQILEVVPVALGRPFHLNRGKAVSPPIRSTL